tara:strand:- start:1214 stop:1753 length:540 start_codon:yes stop_codon:yes gene_type:complete
MKKIFNLGMPKTGTTSFHYLMENLQLKSIHDSSAIPEGYDSYSGCLTDRYEELYKNFPDARYVLTVRNELEWLKSAKKQYSPLNNHGFGKRGFRERIYGTYRVSTLSDNEMLDVYNNWNDKIRNFFKDKDNFMEINFINYFGDSKMLCERLLTFLNIDKSLAMEFPHKNINMENNNFNK